MTNLASAWEAAEAFRLPGSVLGIEVHGDGLIHDTYVVSASAPGGCKRFILQRINRQVFANPVALMKNIECVIHYMQDRAVEAGRDPEREIPGIVRKADGQVLFQANDEAWRMSHYMEGTMTVRGVVSPRQAYQIALTFGRFLDSLCDFPLHLLQNILPGYRDTQLYLTELWRTLDQDRLNRARNVSAEIAFVAARVDQALRLQHLQQCGRLPLRVIHGDTKLNNVLLDIETGQGVCAIDLDTVMPGLRLYDIGDCLREALVGTPEDDIDFAKHELQMVMAIVSGFASSQSSPLLQLERASIVQAVSSITLELGARFLSDYLAGDIYFRTLTSEQNLRRARQHFRLQQRIEENNESLQSAVQQCLGKA